MKIGLRIRKIRELSGKTQGEVAKLLNISQQAYSYLEQAADNAQLDTLRRFCRVMQVDIAYLISDNMPITEETLNKYGRKDFAAIIADNEELEKRSEVWHDLRKQLLQYNSKN